MDDIEGKKPDETMERVLQDYKEGELKSPSGERVTEPKEAIAMALSSDDQPSGGSGDSEPSGAATPSGGTTR